MFPRRWVGWRVASELLLEEILMEGSSFFFSSLKKLHSRRMKDLFFG